MQPRIQYARTSDGVNIACAEAGAGYPFVMMTSPGYSHTELSWKFWPSLIRAATGLHVVLYDARGTR